MRLTLSTDYALRVLLYVGARGDALSRIADIAAAYRISHNHLTKVVSQLGQRGYLTSVRGRFGGLRLARPAGEITVGQVVRDFETDPIPLDCGNCIMARGCQLTCLMRAAMAAFFAELDRTTIADLLTRERAADGPHLGHRAPLFEPP